MNANLSAMGSVAKPNGAAEAAMFGELLARGAAVRRMADGAKGGDVAVAVADGSLLRVRVAVAGDSGHSRRFRVRGLAVADDAFVVCVETRRGVAGDVWAFPSAVFDAYAARGVDGSQELDLDAGVAADGQPLWERLCGFRNRWELITEYAACTGMVGGLEDMEDALAMREAMEAPETEMIGLGDYERFRRARV